MALRKASAAGSEEKERSSLRSCACLAATRVAVKFGGSPAAGAPRNLGKRNVAAAQCDNWMLL